MSHVDEGRIHAYLDGALGPGDPEHAAIEAHLESCAECRAALENERRMRDRAADVLGQIVPDAVRVEPFEKVLAARRAAAAGTGAGGSRTTGGRTDARDGGAQPHRSFYLPMTLAASLVLAVTATWFARAYLPSRPDLTSTASQEAVQADEDARPAAGAAVTETEAVSQPGRNEQAVVDRLGGVEGVASSVAAPPVSQDEPGRAAESKVAAAAPPPAAAAEPGRTSAENRRLADSMLSRPAELQEVSVAAAGQLAAFAGTRDADLAKTMRARAASEGALSWRTVVPDEAALRFGREPLTIDGLVADSIQMGDVAGVPIVRLVYGSEGETVELIQWRAAALVMQESQARQDLPTAAEREIADDASVSFRVFRLGAVEFLIRARLPADSIAALAGRVR